ncbi:type II secretion system F family protein [Candidatus Woesearchaeota archaeon]|nr:type II secretion system F family protein [Candidatus Woesearchaeota archaeon]
MRKNKDKKRDKGRILKKYLRLAGRQVEEYELIHRRVKKWTIIITILLTLIVIYKAYFYRNIKWGILVGITTWTLGFLLVNLFIWILVFLALDLRIFRRKIEVEEVFPDFLMLVASNINAGMTIDRAIIMASRPRFGPLAEDIEEIARKSLAGIDIEQCLKDFSEKYDSPIIKRSIALIIKGIESGGRISELLNKIAIDIQENRTLRKEMAANVTTYTIFIATATLIGAPLLFALATQLINVMQTILGGIDLSSMQSTSIGISINMSGSAIKVSDFKIYAYTLLGAMSIISASMISIIKNGSIKKGWKNIPLFLIITIFIYIIASLLLGKLFQGFQI